MWSTFEKIVEKGIPTILAIIGALLLVCAFVDYSVDQGNQKVKLLASPRALPCLLGVCFLIGSGGLYWQEHLAGSWVHRRKVCKTASGYEVQIGDNSRIAVGFGRIEEWILPPPNEGAVVLPVNEFFDEECFGDPKSSLGAFAKKKFPGDSYQQLLTAVAKSLRDPAIHRTKVLKEPKVEADSFGIGTCISLNRPAGADCRLFLASACMKRAKEGLRAEVSFIFEAVKRIHETMADERIDSLVMPLLGPGKGGLRSEVALFAMILALSEAVRRPSGHHLKSVEIIVFQATASTKPEISRSRVRRILGTASAMFG